MNPLHFKQCIQKPYRSLTSWLCYNVYIRDYIPDQQSLVWDMGSKEEFSGQSREEGLSRQLQLKEHCGNLREDFSKNFKSHKLLESDEELETLRELYKQYKEIPSLDDDVLEAVRELDKQAQERIRKLDEEILKTVRGF